MQFQFKPADHRTHRLQSHLYRSHKIQYEEALGIRDDVAFFQSVQQNLAKRSPDSERPEEELDHAVRQTISRAVAPEGVVDIFAAAGIDRPNISMLSEEWVT